MGLNGSLATVSVPDLLQLLGSTGKTGVLHVYRSGAWKKIYLVGGLVAVVSSSDPDEYVGNALVAHGKITADELRETLDVQMREHTLVGKLLVDGGKVGEDALRRRLNEKAFDVVAKLLVWNDAMFRFEEYDLHRSAYLSLDLPVEQLLMEGIRRADEIGRYRELVPTNDVVVERTDDELAPGLEESMIGVVLGRMDRPRTIEELKRELKSSDYSILESVTRLMEKGVIRTARARSGVPPERPWQQNARELLQSGHFEQSIVTLRQGLSRDPSNAEARQLLEKAEEGFGKSVMAREIPPDSIPEMMESLDALVERSLSPTEAFLLSRISGEADVQTILEAVPLRPAETLMTLRRLVRDGYLRLRLAGE